MRGPYHERSQLSDLFFFNNKIFEHRNRSSKVLGFTVRVWRALEESREQQRGKQTSSGSRHLSWRQICEPEGWDALENTGPIIQSLPFCFIVPSHSLPSGVSHSFGQTQRQTATLSFPLE